MLKSVNVCISQRTRGQKRKRIPICEDREDKIEVCHFIHLQEVVLDDIPTLKLFINQCSSSLLPSLIFAFLTPIISFSSFICLKPTYYLAHTVCEADVVSFIKNKTKVNEFLQPLT